MKDMIFAIVQNPSMNAHQKTEAILAYFEGKAPVPSFDTIVIPFGQMIRLTETTNGRKISSVELTEVELTYFGKPAKLFFCSGDKVIQDPEDSTVKSVISFWGTELGLRSDAVKIIIGGKNPTIKLTFPNKESIDKGYKGRIKINYV